MLQCLFRGARVDQKGDECPAERAVLRLDGDGGTERGARILTRRHGRAVLPQDVREHGMAGDVAGRVRRQPADAGQSLLRFTEVEPGARLGVLELGRCEPGTPRVAVALDGFGGVAEQAAHHAEIRPGCAIAWRQLDAAAQRSLRAGKITGRPPR